MGDLGIHVHHVPFRAGWIPKNVRAVLSNIIKERPDQNDRYSTCETWDNAVLLCESSDEAGNTFPMTLKMQQISPGKTNTWYISIKGTQASARFSTKQINTLEYLSYSSKEQSWCRLDTGYETAFTSITGSIFEFGSLMPFLRCGLPLYMSSNRDVRFHDLLNV